MEQANAALLEELMRATLGELKKSNVDALVANGTLALVEDVVEDHKVVVDHKLVAAVVHPTAKHNSTTTVTHLDVTAVEEESLAAAASAMVTAMVEEALSLATTATDAPAAPLVHTTTTTTTDDDVHDNVATTAPMEDDRTEKDDLLLHQDHHQDQDFSCAQTLVEVDGDDGEDDVEDDVEDEAEDSAMHSMASEDDTDMDEDDDMDDEQDTLKPTTAPTTGLLGSVFQDVVDSIPFERDAPLLTPGLLLVLNVVSGCLMSVLAGLLLVLIGHPDEQFHVAVMLLVAICLFVSIQWYVGWMAVVLFNHPSYSSY